MISSKRASPGTMRVIFQGIAGIAVGAVLLWLAALITLITGYGYCRMGLKHMMIEEPAPADGKEPAKRSA